MNECEKDEWCEEVERVVGSSTKEWVSAPLKELLERAGCDAALAERCEDFAVTAERDRALCQTHNTPLTRADAAVLALCSVRTAAPSPLAAADALLASPSSSSASDAAPLLCRMLAALRAVEPVLPTSLRLRLRLHPAERTTLERTGRIRLMRFVFASPVVSDEDGDDEDEDALMVETATEDSPVLCYDLTRFAFAETGDYDLVLEPGAWLIDAGANTTPRLTLTRLVLARTTDAPGAVAVATAALVLAESSGNTAERVLNMLARSGACEAMHNTALHLLDAGTERGVEAARRALMCAAETGGHAGAQYALAVLCLRGTARTPPDRTRAAALFRAAAEGGTADAWNSLAQCVLAAAPPDAAEAVRCFERGAAAGSALAANNLGLCLRAGLGAPADAARACALFAQAGAAGLPDALVHHAECLLAGTGCAPDEPRALALLRDAARAGSEPAARLLDAISARLKDGVRERDRGGGGGDDTSDSK